MIPAHAATQKTRRPATCRSYRGLAARRWRITNAIPEARATIARPATRVPSFGTAAKLIAEDQRTDQQRRKDAAEVVDRLGPLVHVSGDETHGEDQRHDRERQRDQEDRPPPEVLEQQAREHRPERRDGTPDPRPQRDRLRPLRGRTTAR